MERVFLEEYPELREFDTFRVENTSQKTGKYRSFSFEFREKETCVILSKILNAKTFQAGHTLLLNVLIQGSALNIALKKAFFSRLSRSNLNPRPFYNYHIITPLPW